MADAETDYNTEAQNVAMHVAMQIIAYSGDGRSLAFRAMDAAEKRDFEQAHELLKQSNEAISKAHDVQTDLLVAEANGKQTPFSILLIHSQDHFMTSMLANELITRMVKIYEGDK